MHAVMAASKSYLPLRSKPTFSPSVTTSTFRRGENFLLVPHHIPASSGKGTVRAAVPGAGLGGSCMVVIEVATPLLGAIAAASVHGLTDLQRPPRDLVPYALVLAPIPTELVTPLFIGCSFQHFSRDVGYGRSALLHATFLGLAPVLPQLAWAAFAAFYCLFHAPKHIVQHAGTLDPRLAVAIGATAAMCTFGLRDVDAFPLTDLMQLGGECTRHSLPALSRALLPFLARSSSLAGPGFGSGRSRPAVIARLFARRSHGSHCSR